MMQFEVVVTRKQTQHVSFIVEAESKDDLLTQLDWVEEMNLFSDIDRRFDEGEVGSIDYEVGDVIRRTANMDKLPIDNDLQKLLSQLPTL